MQNFFFSSRRRHTRCSRDWSSDVCSSDLTSATSSSVPKLSPRYDHVEGITYPSPRGGSRTGFNSLPPLEWPTDSDVPRSEERRVGKECRSRGQPNQYKKRQNSETTNT